MLCSGELKITEVEKILMDRQADGWLQYRLPISHLPKPPGVGKFQKKILEDKKIPFQSFLHIPQILSLQKHWS